MKIVSTVLFDKWKPSFFQQGSLRRDPIDRKQFLKTMIAVNPEKNVCVKKINVYRKIQN